MNHKNRLIEKLQNKLKSTEFVWVGSRTYDALPLLDINPNINSITLVGDPKEVRLKNSGLSYEQATSRRVDYDRVGLDDLDTSYLLQVNKYFQTLSKKAEITIVTFSASKTISTIAILLPSIKIAGNYFAFENGFNNKPWVEKQFIDLGIPICKYEYIYSGCKSRLGQSKTGWLLRQKNSTGGEGMVKVTSQKEILSLVQNQSNRIISLTPYLPGAISFNISACIFSTGNITFHPISTQIIGEPTCSDREFGYCGNDYGNPTKILDDDNLLFIENVTKKVGKLLHKYGYIGVFGLDLMKYENKIIVTELNPRFQASSFLASVVMKKMEHSDIYTDHLAAHFNLEPESTPSLLQITREQTPYSQVICYNVQNQPHLSDHMTVNSSGYFEQLPLSKNLEHHSLLFRYITPSTVIDTNNIKVKEDVLKILRVKKESLLAQEVSLKKS
ncbi:MAG: ATP-grasp domain-containing protein [Patescibacteria group bacterium]